MSSIRTIKRRIKSVKSISEITKAMEMISAVRFKRVDGRYRRSLAYTEALSGLLARLMSESVTAGNPLFEERPVRRELLVIVTGDRGLCGSFNTNILRRAEAEIRGAPGREIEVFPIGKVGASFARRRGWKVRETLGDLGYRFTPADLKPLTERLERDFLSGGFDAVNILTTAILKPGVQKPVLENFLGLSFLAGKREESAALEYIFEPDAKTTFETLVNLYIRQRLFFILLRSVTAEYNARMIAMKLATDNGKEIVRELTLERNKVRQAMITKEISEIIGGVNALT